MNTLRVHKKERLNYAEEKEEGRDGVGEGRVLVLTGWC